MVNVSGRPLSAPAAAPRGQETDGDCGAETLNLPAHLEGLQHRLAKIPTARMLGNRGETNGCRESCRENLEAKLFKSYFEMRLNDDVKLLGR